MSRRSSIRSSIVAMSTNDAPISIHAGRMSNSLRHSLFGSLSLSGEEAGLLGRKLEGAPPGVEAPPLLVWIGPALLCALAYALYNIFIKKGSASINPVLGGVILQFVAALLGSALLSVVVLKEGMGVITYDSSGVMWSMCAGVAVGVAEMLSFCVSGMGVQATQSIPIIIGGSVMFGSVLGLIMLHEVLTFHGWFGVALLVTGICFVATDPGPKVVAH